MDKIIHDSIFHNAMGLGMNQLFSNFATIFWRDGYHCISQHRRDGFSLTTITPKGMGKI